MSGKTLFFNVIKFILPFLLGAGILWWMYRGIDWTSFLHSVRYDMRWGWMLLSLVFGVLAQLHRSWRWRVALAPLGERPRAVAAACSIFLSYALSLVVPRLGEVARCGTLTRYEGANFPRAVGTVVTERIVDCLMMILLLALAFFLQLPAFVAFWNQTGMSLNGIVRQFTATGYLVTLICFLSLLALGVFLLFRLKAFRKGRELFLQLWEGVASLKAVKKKGWYAFHSVMIWVSYFLHFYIAFFCFDFTAHIGIAAAFLIFCIGSVAVIVPTPNGAGPWHFAVKTMLVLYGVAEGQAILFALVVHAIQTALVVLLGLFGWTRLGLLRPLRASTPNKT